MEPFFIAETKSTPEVTLNKATGTFQFKGWSKPENTLEFYNPIVNWLTEYTKSPNPSTQLVFNMDYFNSSSSKIILNIVRIMEEILKKGLEVKVSWYYNDEDTLEAGEAYKSLTEVSFEFIKK